jgi:hypothetical protein
LVSVSRTLFDRDPALSPCVLRLSAGVSCCIVTAAREVTTWLFEGTTTDDYLSWNYREVIRKDGTTYLDRFLDRDINIRTYISAELSFREGKLASWKMLPKPAGNTILAPQPFIR